MSRANGDLMRERIRAAVATLTARDERPPTLREIADVVGIKSTGHIAYHMRLLHAAGVITREPHMARTTRILAPDPEPDEQEGFFRQFAELRAENARLLALVACLTQQLEHAS